MIATVALLRHGGSHLIRPIVAELGYDILEPGNFDTPLDQAQGQVIVFVRDPRDRMVATRRWWLDKPMKTRSMSEHGKDADHQIAWLLDEGGFMPEMLLWARVWCSWPGALKVRFEDMREDGPREIARIVEHLGLPAIPARDREIWHNVWLKGRTYTGSHSDWRQAFGKTAKSVWALHGGPDLLQMMGYDG